VDLGQSFVLGAIGDWVTALLLVALIVSWWSFLVWWISRYGAREVEVTFRSSAPPDQALREWTDYYGLWLAGARYEIVDQRADRVAFIGYYRPRWEIAAAVLLFPVGLITLLGTLPAELVATTAEGGVVVEGKMHRLMAKELEKDAAAGVLESLSPDRTSAATPR
jgi:hypothetical protein